MFDNGNPPMLIPRGEPFFYPGNEIGCLLVHGFTDSPLEMKPFGQYLNEKGYTVLGLRSAGHATHISDLRRMRWQDLLAAVEDGFHLLKSNKNIKKIVIIGHSMGGALTLVASSYLPVDGLVALAPPYRQTPSGFIPENIGAFKVFWGSAKRKFQSRNLPERLPGWYWYQPELSRGYIKYNEKPLICNLQLIRIANHVPDALRKIKCPTLLMGACKDSIVNPDTLKLIYDSLTVEDKEMVMLEKSSHMLPIDGERELVFEHTHRFIQKYVETPINKLQ